MPMDWNDAAMNKLMATIFAVCDVKVNQAQKVEIAKIMGSDCTAKAVGHRITALKKGAESSTATLANDAAGEDEAPKPKKGRAAKAAPRISKTTFKGRAADHAHPMPPTPEPTAGDAEEGGDMQLTPPKSNEKKRKATPVFKVEGLDDGTDIEVGEEIGQGLRKKRVKKEVAQQSEAEDDDDDERL